MDISKTIESKYLKAEDLNGHAHTVTITGVRMEDLAKQGEAPEPKPVLHMQGWKPYPLNITNRKKLMELFGSESDAWVGKEVEMYIVDTEIGGQPRKGIRYRAPVQDVNV